MLANSSHEEAALPLENLWFDPDVISYFEHVDSCTGEINKMTPIEPLVGFLRHPKALCFWKEIGTERYTSDQYRIDKDYIILAQKGEIRRSRGKVFFFDLGASTYFAGAGGASQSWFVETYERLGIPFDRIIAWEPKRMVPDEIFKDVPEAIISKLAYFNLGISEPGTKHDPLRFILPA